MIFWIIYYSIPNGLKLSLFFLAGIATLIIGFYIFINLNHNEEKAFVLKFKGLSENLIKLILLLLIISSLFITPVYGPRTVVLWSRLSTLHYIKAIISLIGCAFLPGANIFSIFFPNEKLSKRFKVEPFLLKVTIYPILSFCFLGVSVLILEILGFLSDTIIRFLITLILGLFLIDFIIQKFRDIKINLNTVNMEVSKHTGIILIFAFGIMLISLGILINTQYLIIGDSWVGMVSANYIGHSNFDSFDENIYSGHYPMFWGFIIYALSVISGLPFVNINVLLAPFCYLFITTSYLLLKAILYNNKEKYAVLSTIFMSCFLGFSYFFSDYRSEVGRLGIVALCEFYLIYKTFGFFLFFLALAIFIILIRSNEEINIKYRQILLKEDHKYLLLSAFFLIISFMTYMIPLFIGLSFAFLFCLFSENRYKSFSLRFFTILALYISFFFIIFDTLMYEYLSWILAANLEIFFQITPETISENISREYLIYSIFIGISISSLILQQLFRLLFEEKRISKFILGNHYKSIFEFILKITLIAFSFFLIVEVVGLFYERIFGVDDLSKNYFFFLFLDYTYLYIGFIGIIGICVSFYLFRKEKNLFFYLAICILFSFFLAFLLIIRYSIKYHLELPKDIPSSEFIQMRIWFERIWFYSIPSLCIFASYGLFKLVKTLNTKFLIKKKKHYKSALKYISTSFFIFFLFSGLTTAGMWYGSDKGRIRNNEILVIGWASENLPEDSKIIIERTYNIDRGLQTMTTSRIYYLNEEFKEDINVTENIKRIERMKSTEIEYLLVSKDYLSESNNISIFVKHYLIPDFYYEKVYENDDYLVFYAPYFD